MNQWSPTSFSAKSPDDDLLTTVVGRYGAPYRCPNISSVDRHIAELYRRIGYASPRFPGLVDEFWAEIDLLLDRRMWLERDPDLHAAA